VTYYPNEHTVIVGFEHGSYNISEGIGSINVCVQVTGVPQSLLHLSLTTVDGTATASADYTSIVANLRFGRNRRKQCVQIPVINDIVPEVQECFRVMLTIITPSPGIILIPDSATIVINSDDGKCQ